MKEKVSELLHSKWLLEVTEDMLLEIDQKWGFDTFMRSYYLQLEFSKQNGGAMSK